jgi:hypothetical protein
MIKTTLLLFLVFLVSCQKQEVTSVPSNSDRSVVLKSPSETSLPGVLTGQVLGLLDEMGITGATITIKKGKKVITTATTDAKGKFKVIGLPAGIYHVTAVASNFGTLTIRSIPISSGGEVTTHFILPPVTVFPQHHLSKTSLIQWVKTRT